MNINDLIVDPVRTLGRKLIVTGVSPRYVYQDGARTAEIRGYAYTCVCPERSYIQVRVAVEGPRMIDDAAIAANAVVVLHNPEIKVYQIAGECRVSIAAAGIHTVKGDG